MTIFQQISTDEESPEIRKQNISVQAKRRAANVVIISAFTVPLFFPGGRR